MTNFEVIHDEEYSGMGHDVVLKSGLTAEDAIQYMHDWAHEKAKRVLHENDEKFQTVKAAYLEQLSRRAMERKPLCVEPQYFISIKLVKNSLTEIEDAIAKVKDAAIDTKVLNIKETVVELNFYNEDSLNPVKPVRVRGYYNFFKYDTGWEDDGIIHITIEGE